MPPLDLDEKFALMASIEGYDGVEIVFPYEVKDPEATRQRCWRKYGLNVAAVNVNVKAEPEFETAASPPTGPRCGKRRYNLSRTPRISPPAWVRTRSPAVRWATATSSPSSMITQRRGTYLVETFSEAGSYKARRSRFSSSTNPARPGAAASSTTAAKALCLLNDIGNTDMGVTLDFGHSMYGNETSGRSGRHAGRKPVSIITSTSMTTTANGTGITSAAPSISSNMWNLSTT
jgi:xylose isomerase